MGPPLFCGGELSSERMPTMHAVLQWGRRCSAAESGHRVKCFAVLPFASMGPPLFCGGEARAGTRRRAAPRRFNGAAAVLRRRVPCAGVIEGRLMRFNGAAAVLRRREVRPRVTEARGGALQWGRRCSAAERSAPPPIWRNARVLQWGRRCSAAERSALPLAGHRSSALQWGRRCSAAESGEGGIASFWPHQLQWGRRCSAAERKVLRLERWPNLSASMGPPLFCGGENVLCEQVDNADLTLQWGRRCSAAESTRADASLPRHQGFNGAAAVLRRREGRRAPVHRGCPASMGPPLFCGGESLRTWPRRPCGTRFNGAAAVLRRRGVQCPQSRVTAVASMGPPLFCGGETRPALETFCRGIVLQWGRRCSAAERKRSERLILWACRFNGAAAVLRRRADDDKRLARRVLRFNGAAAVLRRRGDRRAQDRGTCRASMGPPLFCGGEEYCRGHGIRRVVASMGPPLFCGGEARRTVRCERRSRLQWGRRCSAAERACRLPANSPGRWLQWGRRCSAAERIRAYQHDVHVATWLQWGRRCSAAESGRGAARYRLGRFGFNGAAAVLRRRESGALAYSSEWDGLQCVSLQIDGTT